MKKEMSACISTFAVSFFLDCFLNDNIENNNNNSNND